MPAVKKTPKRVPAKVPARKFDPATTSAIAAAAAGALSKPSAMLSYIAVRMTVEERAYVDANGGSAYVRELVRKAKARFDAKGAKS
jgi:hypothetical protein